MSVVQSFAQAAVTGLRIPAGHHDELFRNLAHVRFDSIMINRAVGGRKQCRVGRIGIAPSPGCPEEIDPGRVTVVMCPTLKTASMAGIFLLCVLVGIVLIASASAEESATPSAMALEIETAQAQATASPRFVYASGAQGVGYYASPAPRTAAPQARRGSGTVGPGVRNWTTGRRSPLHRPWLNSQG